MLYAFGAGFDNHKNFCYSTIVNPPSPANSGKTFTINSSDAANFPAPPFNITVCPISAAPTIGNAEILRVTNVSGSTFIAVRIQEGTSARVIQSGDRVMASFTSTNLQAIEAVLGNFPPYGIYIGTNATSGSQNNIAIGNNASAPTNQGLAIGYSAYSGGTNSIAIGVSATNTRMQTIALGNFASASAASANAIGYNAQANGSSSTAIGSSATTSTFGDIAIGDTAAASGGSSLAAGLQSISSGTTSTGLGTLTIASGTSATAVGYHAHASALASTSLGSSANACHSNRSSGYSYICGFDRYRPSCPNDADKSNHAWSYLWNSLGSRNELCELFLCHKLFECAESFF